MNFGRYMLTFSRFGNLAAFTSAVLLVVAGVFVTLYEEELYRNQQVQETRVQAQILAASVTAALVFNDRMAAQEYVDALQANAQVEAAGVYDTAGVRIAGFVRNGTEGPPLRLAPTAKVLISGNVVVTAPILQATTVLGTVYLRISLEAFARRAVRYFGIFLLVAMAVLVVFVASGAQRALTRANDALTGQARELAGTNVKLQDEMEQRAKAEEALRQSQKMEAIGQLSGGIAHDFNNLLTIIKGNLQLMHRRIGQGQTDVSRYIDAAMEGVNRAANLTQRILAFSRRQPLTPKALSISDLLANMRDLLRHSVGTQVQIEMRLDADWLALCDANQMENVVLNLAINASDAMPEGGRLLIATTNRPSLAAFAAADYVEIEVSDTGIGMTAEVKQRAVDPFFTTKPQGKGTGLGLSMTFGYVQQSGGHLEIDSEPGKGTTIRILMPRYHQQSLSVSA